MASNGSLCVTLALFYLSVQLCRALSIDNAIIGKVYVKGQFTNVNCREDYSTGIRGARPIAGIVITHGECQMGRQRMITPDNGMQFSTVVVISFHPTFITQVDKAFKIKCMYRETVRTVQSEIGVSALSTATITHSFPMPECRYEIRKDSIDGALLRYARVGESVVHRWECNSKVYGILVHSCFVEDGQGEKVMVIDERGCHVDDYVLGDPTYADDLSLAYREAQVIKFADRVSVRYQCQIRLCMKEEGGCDDVTPPQCTDRKVPTSLLIDVAELEEPRQNLTVRAPTASLERPIDRLPPPRDSRRGSSEERREPSWEDDRPLFPTTNRRRFFSAKRLRRSAEEDESVFEPVNGDFISQEFYVLDTTEDPDKEKSVKRASLNSFIQSAGGIVAQSRDPLPTSDGGSRTVCLSVTIFALLTGAVCCIFIAVAFIAMVFCVRKYWHGGQGSTWEKSSPPSPSGWTAHGSSSHGSNGFLASCFGFK